MSSPSPLSAPLITTIEITKRCNLKCLYCYSGATSNTEMPASKVLGLVTELSNKGVWQIVIAGGEPFLHRNILEILDQIAAAGISIGITSNGTVLRGALLRSLGALLKKYPEFLHVQISLDSHDPVENDKTRGAGENVVKNIEDMAANGFNIGIATVLHRYNVNCAHSMIDFFYPRVKKFHFINLMRSAQVDICDRKLFASQDMLNIAYERILSRKRMYRDATITYPDCGEKYLRGESPSMECSGCIGATTRMDINADGTVLACNIADTSIIGNVWKNSLNDIWRSQLADECRAAALPLCVLASLKRKAIRFHDRKPPKSLN